MLEDQVANLLQRYLGDYVRGLNKEALKISVWQGLFSPPLCLSAFVKFYYEVLLFCLSLVRSFLDTTIKVQ